MPFMSSSSISTSNLYRSSPHARHVRASLLDPSSVAVKPSFICTICWQPQYPPSTPRVLGTESRISCHGCWKAVSDLSICWACGQVIVRGEEVVSLGWCFWHRSCFGCLACGKSMSLPASVAENNKERKSLGLELDVIPMCDDCEDDAGDDGNETLLETELGSAGCFDGGQSSDRLDMMKLNNDERRVERSRWTPRKFKGSSGLERDLTKFINGRSTVSEVGLQSTIEEADIPVTGRASEPPKAPAAVESCSLIPAKQFAMKELRKVSARLTRISNDFENSESEFSPIESEGYTAFPKFDYSKLKTSPRSPLPEGPKTIGITARDNRTRPTTISFESTPAKEHSIARTSHRSRKRSRTLHADDLGAMAYDSEETPARQRTPYPNANDRPVIERIVSQESTSCHPNMSLGTTAPPSNPRCSPSPFTSPHTPPSLIIPSYKKTGAGPVHSSEYIDTYHPHSCDIGHQKYRPSKVEHILEKIKRQNVGRQKLEDVAAIQMRRRQRERSGERMAAKLGIEEYGLDPRRQDMNRELRYLFNEE
ncbi:hypothetical protein BJ878DRAFT_573048 [Calycina marina]|uniref:LIM zinc-binding domain-containing protein n=1 Tax=Calycina marina TaxID=1763456 RepID=A0A9P8CHS9_9HELO|nr:hypothetical protein BJ878DRAFT_573048 [Calycina marina]